MAVHRRSGDHVHHRNGIVPDRKEKEVRLLNEKIHCIFACGAYAADRLWEVCPNPVYVADPTKGFSKHSRGNTVDISLIKTNGDPVEMPSGFDDFTSRADRNYSDVSQAAGENARYLEEVMTAAGFVGYSGEWWHYSDSVDYPVVQ
ncbi:MAG: M15 family metallopeptidase [Oscillospiraceae bacterium]